MAQVNLPNVKAHRDRYKKMRYYFRRAGSRLIALPGVPGSAEFMEAYDKARAGHVPIGSGGTIAGTVDALAVQYYEKSDEWKALAYKTQLTRKIIIEQFRVDNGKFRVALLRTSHLDAIMKAIPKASMKKHWLTTIRALLKFACPMLRPDNPADALRLGKHHTDGHWNWDDHEIDQYRAHWPNGTEARLAFEIGLEGLSRRGEIVMLGPQHVKGNRIKIARLKGNPEVDIEMTPELAAAVHAMPKGHLSWFITRLGKPRSAGGLSKIFPQWVKAAGLPSRCVAHGLKKAGLRRMGEIGCTTLEMMGVSGHTTLESIEIYTRGFDRKKAGDRAIAKRREHTAV
jgi:integrase